MPEGPEVETVRRSLEPLLMGTRLGRGWVSRDKLRTPVTTRQLQFLSERRITGIGRHGKLLWIDIEGGVGLLIRLGMTGRLLVVDASEPRALHTHVVFPLDAGERELRYVDVRRFGEVVPFSALIERDEERARLGPDPLSWDDDGRTRVVERWRNSTRTLKDCLLDQSCVAGVGNIYACEALFLAGLSPLARGIEVPSSRLAALAAHVEDVLHRAVEHRGTSFSDFVDGVGERGQHLAHVHVFQREGEPCPKCTRPIARLQQGGRSTFMCQRCQPAVRPGAARVRRH